MARGLLLLTYRNPNPARLIMKPLPQGSLTRELAVVLAVKLVLITTIKLVYFSDAEKPGSEGVAQALLSLPNQGSARHD